MNARVVVALVSALAALALPAAASASQLIDRNAAGVDLKVDDQGLALLTYRARNKIWHVVAWGALNAISPTAGRPQVRLRLDYSGGRGRLGHDVAKGFRNTCRPYDGPALAWFVAGCKAADGTHWAIQSWQRLLPNYGVQVARPEEQQWDLRLSHWRGELPVLTIKLDWAYRRYDHLYGSLTYRGKPVHGFSSTPTGNPLDTHGRNIYVDTFDSAYGPGWFRENAFLAHNPTGAFCYGFYPHAPRPAGKGEKYRATVIGPGVTPDLFWQADAPGPYDRGRDLSANDELRALGDGLCRPN